MVDATARRGHDSQSAVSSLSTLAKQTAILVAATYLSACQITPSRTEARYDFRDDFCVREVAGGPCVYSFTPADHEDQNARPIPHPKEKP